eukprot:1160238-Pelagomonas_calceolata.AAC.1
MHATGWRSTPSWTTYASLPHDLRQDMNLFALLAFPACRQSSGSGDWACIRACQGPRAGGPAAQPHGRRGRKDARRGRQQERPAACRRRWCPTAQPAAAAAAVCCARCEWPCWRRSWGPAGQGRACC